MCRKLIFCSFHSPHIGLARRFPRVFCTVLWANPDFPGGLVVGDLPANAGGTGSIPDQERFHLPQLLKAVHHRAHAPQQEKTPGTATREEPPFSATREKPMQQGKPNTAKSK